MSAASEQSVTSSENENGSGSQLKMAAQIVPNIPVPINGMVKSFQNEKRTYTRPYSAKNVLFYNGHDEYFQVKCRLSCSTLSCLGCSPADLQVALQNHGRVDGRVERPDALVALRGAATLHIKWADTGDIRRSTGEYGQVCLHADALAVWELIWTGVYRRLNSNHEYFSRCKNIGLEHRIFLKIRLRHSEASSARSGAQTGRLAAHELQRVA